MASSNLVTVGAPKTGGAVFRAPKGTALPTDATSTLESAFVDLGFISEDGVENENSRSSEEIKDWSGAIVLTPQTEKKDTFTLTFLESKNVDVLKVIYGADNVTGTLATGITVKSNAKELESHAWVIDMVTTDGDLKRVTIPDGKISELGTVSYKNDEAVGFETTITAMPDASGNTHYEYIVKKPTA